MTQHLGGPETEEQLVDRHQRYLDIQGETGRMFAIVLEPGGEVAGSIGFWARTWRDEPVYETGWGVLPEFQGRGVAVAAARAVVAEAAGAVTAAGCTPSPPSSTRPPTRCAERPVSSWWGSARSSIRRACSMVSHDWMVDLTAVR